MNKPGDSCILEDRSCISCGECDLCDLDSSKKCDNCCQCIEFSKGDFAEIVIEDILFPSDKQTKPTAPSQKGRNK